MNHPQTLEQTLWLTLGDWSLMAITGSQAHSFLQGQVTCDLRELGPDNSLLGAHCNPKGRILFSFRALAPNEEQILLRLPSGMCEATRQALGKYIAFARAELTDDPEQRQGRGLVGSQAREWLSRELTEPAREIGGWVSEAGQIILTLGEQRFECWLSPERAGQLDRQWTGARAEGGDNLWRLLDIEAGLGEIHPQTREACTPQALNLPEVGGVSFRKGCYTGQEVVARLHYKGKTKRRLHHLRLENWGEDSPLPPPGEPIHSDRDKALGEVILAARAGDGSLHLLAVTGEAVKTADRVNLKGGTHPVQIQPLPYTTE